MIYGAENVYYVRNGDSSMNFKGNEAYYDEPCDRKLRELDCPSHNPDRWDDEQDEDLR